MSSLAVGLEWLFGGNATPVHFHWWQVVARGTFLYVAGVLIVRIGKSRLLSRATTLDIILAFMLGSVLGRGILGSAAISESLVAAVTLVGLHWLLSRMAMQSHAWGNLLKGTAYQLVDQGKILPENLRRAHLSERDLYEEFRLRANVNDLSAVEAAYKERSGEVGVVRRPVHPQILEIEVKEGVQTVRIVWTYGPS